MRIVRLSGLPSIRTWNCRCRPGGLTRALALLLCAMFVLAGCDKAAPAGESPEHAVSKPLPASSPAYTFGIIYPMAHPFYEMMTMNAQEAAAASGVQLIVKAPDEANLEQQIRMMETMISRQVDGIAINPVDKTALTPMINKAIEAGIPVVCFESDAPKSKRIAYIGADNKASGVMMGMALDELLEGEGMVLIETGMSRMTAQQLRLEGLLDYINTSTRIQVLEVGYNEGQESLALTNLEQMIKEHPHFDAFIALDVISGSTSVLVWKASGLNRYALTFGLTPEIGEALRNGQITTVVSQNEQDWGKRIIGRLLEASSGIAIPEFDDTGMKRITAASIP